MDELIVLAHGSRAQTEVSVADATSSYAPTPESREWIERGWKLATEKMAAQGRRFYNGELWRVETVTSARSGISIGVSPSMTYKDVVGMRALPDFLAHFNDTALPWVLSVIAVIRDAEGNILLVERDTGDWEKSYELSGGFVFRSERDVFAAIRKRVSEDLDIGEDGIKNLLLSDIFRYPAISETMCLFTIDLKSAGAGFSRNVLSVKDAASWEEKKRTETLHWPSSAILDYWFSKGAQAGA